MEKRRAMEIFPTRMRKLWNEWELRTMVVISLILQVFLIIFGKRRKYTARNWLRIIIWLAYLLADWVAAISLGILSNKQGDSSNKIDGGSDHSLDPNDVLTGFWAPFLLLHLGGPDTISAYALEDNELWLRHLLGLIFQFCVAFYVFIRSWTGSQILFLSIPMFVTGMIKYGERTWVLRSSSRKHFRDSLLTPLDPLYAKFMEEYNSKIAEGYIVEVDRVIDSPNNVGLPEGTTTKDIIPAGAEIIRNAHSFLETCKRLFADLTFSSEDIRNSHSYFLKSCCEDAFKVIEAELAFMYDAFYTKSTVVYTKTGFILRLISFSSTVSAFVALLIIDKHGFSNIDLIITHLLLVGAIVLEIYAAILLLLSDQTIIHYLSKHNTRLVNRILGFRLQTKMWSGSMAQYNLLNFCLKKRPTKFARLQKVFCIYEEMERHRYTTFKGVSPGLKEFIFLQLTEKAATLGKQLCTSRGALILVKNNEFREFIEVDFDQSILVWHIATYLCYNSDLTDTIPPDIARKTKCVSKYMLYLLVMCPFMLPNGIGEIRFRDTCSEAMDFFKRIKFKRNYVKEACTTLLKVETKFFPSEVKGDISKSVLFDACRLANLLQKLGAERKWEIMSHVWVEMLFYAASQCRGYYHAQQLRRGGELLTHVWLLMANLGISEKIQISKGILRAKLRAR